MVMKELDEDLAMESRNNRILIQDLNEFDGSTEAKPDSLLMTKDVQPDTVQSTANNDDFLNLKSDYDRNLKQRDEEVERKDSGANQVEISNSEADSLKSKANRRSLPSVDQKTTPRAAKSKHFSSANSRATSSSSKTMLRSSAPSKATSATPAPTRKPTTPSTKANLSASDRPGKKIGPATMLKSSTPDHGASQMMKLRPSSASNGKTGQKSCSPRKARANSNCNGGGDDVNPVLMGTRMVERVVNMRKLAPPKQENCVSVDKTKKSSVENSGFGRSLSKKSLDMAIRHMDIGRSIS